MKYSKKKQIKLKPEHYIESTPAEQQLRNLSPNSPMREGGNTRQTTLEEFYSMAKEGVIDPNAN